MRIGKDIPWTFKTWIVNFKGVDLPIGDLADEIAGDPDFPAEDYFGDILEYLSMRCKNDTVIIETFVLAWSYYLSSKDPSWPSPTLTIE